MDTNDSLKKISPKKKRNPFILFTIILGILTIYLFITSFSTKAISENEAMDNFEKFASPQIEGLEILGAERNGNFYKIYFNSSQTGESAAYITADGEYLVTGLIPLSIIDSIPNNTQPVN